MPIVLVSLALAFCAETVTLAVLALGHLGIGLAFSTDRKWVVRYLIFVGTAFFFFALVYGVDWSAEKLRATGSTDFVQSWFKIALILSAVICGTRPIQKIGVFFLLMRLHVPTHVMYVIFQAFVIVERFEQKAERVVLGLQTRGQYLGSIVGRITALVEAFVAMANGIIVELDERDLAHTSHGFELDESKRTLPSYPTLKALDGIYICAWGILALAWQAV